MSHAATLALGPVGAGAAPRGVVSGGVLRLEVREDLEDEVALQAAHLLS